MHHRKLQSAQYSAILSPRRWVRAPARTASSSGAVFKFAKAWASIHASNVMIVDPDTNEATRIGKQVMSDGTRVRIGRKSGTVIDK